MSPVVGAVCVLFAYTYSRRSITKYLWHLEFVLSVTLRSSVALIRVSLTSLYRWWLDACLAVSLDDLMTLEESPSGQKMYL